MGNQTEFPHGRDARGVIESDKFGDSPQSLAPFTRPEIKKKRIRENKRRTRRERKRGRVQGDSTHEKETHKDDSYPLREQEKRKRMKKFQFFPLKAYFRHSSSRLCLQSYIF